MDPEAAAHLAALEESWRREVAALPSYRAVAASLERAVARCEEGQRQTHAAACGDGAPLRAWAEGLEGAAGYRWWEVAAGASSSVAAHALIAAAAADETTAADAAAIDAAYFPSIGALTVLLDDLVDREEDRARGEHNYVDYYASPEAAAERIASVACLAEDAAQRLPRAGRHRAILAGVAAFYLSAPEAKTDFARPLRTRLLDALGPGTRPLAAFMGIRRRGERRRPGRAGSSPGP